MNDLLNEYIVSMLDNYDLVGKLKKYNKIYIYGAGLVGQSMLKYLSKNGMAKIIVNFFTTDYQNTIINNIPVKQFDKNAVNNDGIILLAAKREVRKQLKNNCDKVGVNNYLDIIFFDDERDYEWYSSLPEQLYPEELRRWYKFHTGYDLDLDNPKSFNEKINWSKLYDRDERKTEYADKYLVRKYVEEKVGDKYLVPILGVWKSFDDIDFSSLPKKFILKCNHGSGWNIYVEDKDNLDLEETRKKLTEWLNTNYAFVSGLELHYKGIKPLILAERIIGDKQLRDYKLFTFNGKVKLIQVDIDRWGEHKRNLYTKEWELLPYSIQFPNSPENEEKRPENLEEMIEVAERLGVDFSFVRVDLYNYLGKIYFGELTFTHGSGIEKFDPEFFSECLGNEWCICK